MCWCSCCPWVNVQANGGSSTSWVNGSFRRWGLQFPWHSHCYIDPRGSRSCYHVLSLTSILNCVLSCLALTIHMAIVYCAESWCNEEMVSEKPFLTAVDSVYHILPVLLLSYVHAPLTKSGTNRCSFFCAVFLFTWKGVAPIEAVSAVLILPFGKKKFFFSWVSLVGGDTFEPPFEPPPFRWPRIW